MNRHRRKANQGMTLVEVLVALFIVAIALGAAVQSVGKAVSNETVLRDQLFARWVASNRITKLRLEKQWPNLGSTNGDATMASQEWTWTQLIEKTPTDNVRSVTISVRQTDSGEQTSLASMTSFLTN